jgi:hypothetical protein
MSTSLQDFKNEIQFSPSRYPDLLTETEEGDAVDLLQADGLCFAVQVVGTVSGTSPSMTGKMQESSDNSTWTDITGAVFTAVTAAVNTQVINFHRTKRYVRHYATIAGNNPVFNFTAIIGEQKKLT